MAELGQTRPAEPRERVDPPRRLGARLLLGILFGALVYAGLVLYGDLDGMRAALASFPLLLLPVAMGLSLLNYAIRFVRWERYRTLLGIRLDRRTSFTIYLAGLALTVTPGKMGETFKSFLIREVEGTRVHKSAPIVVAERFTDLLGFLILLALGGLATAPEKQWIFWSTLALCAVLLVLAGSQRVAAATVALVARLPLVSRLAPHLQGALESTRVLLAPRELLLPTALSTAGWSCECIGFWLIASAFVPGGVPLAFATYVYALSAVAGAVLILFPGGLGPTEASMGALLGGRYQALGLAPAVARASALSATLLVRLCTLWFAVVVGLVALGLFGRRRRALAADAART